MRRKIALALIPASLFMASCETPLDQAWNNTVSAMTQKKESDRELLYGHGDSTPTPRPKPTPSPTTPAQPAPTLKKVRLKSFLESGDTPATADSSPTPKSSPTPDSSSKPQKSPTPVAKETPKKDGGSSEPVKSPAPEKTAEPAPFATKVPGKKGYVTSPFSPSSGLIDVSGLPPGSEARDPYSGKIFRVP